MRSLRYLIAPSIAIVAVAALLFMSSVTKPDHKKADTAVTTLVTHRVAPSTQADVQATEINGQIEREGVDIMPALETVQPEDVNSSKLDALFIASIMEHYGASPAIKTGNEKIEAGTIHKFAMKDSYAATWTANGTDSREGVTGRTALNPMSTILAGYRSAFLELPPPSIESIGVLMAWTAAAFLGGALFFRQSKMAFADVL